MGDDDYTAKYLKYKKKYTILKESMARNIDFPEATNKKELRNMSGGSKNDKIDIMLFKAEWCGHCTNFKPTWSKLKEQYSTKFNFITYDSDKDADMMKKWDVNGFPTIMMKDGDEVKPYEGSRDYVTLQNILNNLIKK